MTSKEILYQYGRQMILPCIGITGQEEILRTKVLLVGAGGIGSSAAMYLATAGINLTIMDHDQVDQSNLHRQILHDHNNQGINKAESAIQRLQLLNPTGQYTAITEQLIPSNALNILSQYDLIIDGTDNFTARYIMNDACVILNKPLISGSAVGLEGQITVIIPQETACYRCLYPNPSLAENCRSCANAGILGPVAGMIGCLEAIEAIKLILKKKDQNESANSLQLLSGRQMLYDASTGEVHVFDLPKRNLNCTVCGDHPTITNELEVQKFISNLQNLAKLASDKYIGELAKEHQISCLNYHELYRKGEIPFHLLIDVRAVNQYTLTSLTLDKMMNFSSVIEALQYIQPQNEDLEALPSAISFNLPLLQLQDRQEDRLQSVKQIEELLHSLQQRYKLNNIPIYVLCRRGIDSTVAARLLLKESFHPVFNLAGGLTTWKEEVDPHFPMY